ncbi:MAG: cation:proton antiporter [Bacilli bacterium]|jgi:Kef-type K+ transport system membrane component KefB|nr:cation:proton antiporter [Bacilli bacterium]
MTFPFDVEQYYAQFGQIPSTLIGLAIMLFVAFLLTRLTKLMKLPNVTAYIISGVILGPFFLGAIPTSLMSGMSFISDVALAFIAFGVGRYFSIDTLKKTGKKVIVITLMESLVAGLVVTFVCKAIFWNSVSWAFALLLGAIATATAPASTMMTIRQYQAKGEFVDVLLQVVSLDDAVCLIVYTLAIAIVNVLEGGQSVDLLKTVGLPLVYNLAGVVLGFFFGFIHSKVMSSKRSPDNRLILTVACLLAICGICELPFISISPLMCCMVFGASYVNFKKNKEVFDQLDGFTPPIMCLFFVYSGMKMDFSNFAVVGLLGVVYFFARIVGKYGGAWLGCKMVKEPKPVTVNLGLALVPQAGVAIGLADLGARLLGDGIGTTFLSIILCSSVLYEMIGPGLAKLALVKSGSIPLENLHPQKLVPEEEAPKPAVLPATETPQAKNATQPVTRP